MYIDDYYDKEGILLDFDNIRKNPGLRQLAKLMLNSFWGKFGQRTNLTQTTYVTDPAIYFDMLTSDSQCIKNVRMKECYKWIGNILINLLKIPVRLMLL